MEQRLATTVLLDDEPVLRTRPISREELWRLAPALADLLVRTVRRGPALGFLSTLTRPAAERYWRSLGIELDTGSRVLVVAWWRGHLVGSGQLAIPPETLGRHRVEIEKLLVAEGFQGRGIGRALVTALHQAARERGRSLVVLHTRRDGPADRFYASLGYQVVGVVPGYARTPSGERHDHVFYYRMI